MEKHSYCESRFQTKRFKTRVVNVGIVSVGGDNPIRIQSMTTTPTQDIEATVRQSIALAEVGCEIVRITAPNVPAAKALKDIRKQFTEAGFGHIPLAADIHFLPKAAMEAVEHVEKVRVNPGNYADKKKFAIIEYSDAQYNEELERIYEAFSPLVLRAKELGRSMRIGTNHGSLSDRIMNRYGDTPLGMVEAALEFVRIAESHDYQDLILSLKASNPKVMIQAYRLCIQKMKEENMNYPLHLGVTEAGDGEDGRIKSAIGIGSLLADGIGDTIRVSLTENPVYEIPVAQDLARIAHKLWDVKYPITDLIESDSINPFEYKRRTTINIKLNDKIGLSPSTPPPVFVKTVLPLSSHEHIAREILKTNNASTEVKVEGLIVEVNSKEDLKHLTALQSIILSPAPVFALELGEEFSLSNFNGFNWAYRNGWILCKAFSSEHELEKFLKFIAENNIFLAIDCHAEDLKKFKPVLEKYHSANIIYTSTQPSGTMHPIGTYRMLVQELKNQKLPQASIWIRNTEKNTINLQNFFTSRLLEASTFSGNLFCDGIGDFISIETEPDLQKATTLGYNILQGTRLRLTKTEFVACPSCGRTLFDLEKTTQAIRAKTGHLKGVTIAVMGCIVNGPGEMADADFGYVGGAPDKINLYVGKECVKYNIPQEEAVERLIDLIKEHNKWFEPEQIEATI